MQCSSAAGCTTCAPSPEPGTPCTMPTDPPSSPWKRHPRQPDAKPPAPRRTRDDEPAAAESGEHTTELQPPMRLSYAVFCLKNKTAPEEPLRNADRTRIHAD